MGENPFHLLDIILASMLPSLVIPRPVLSELEKSVLCALDFDADECSWGPSNLWSVFGDNLIVTLSSAGISPGLFTA